MASHGVWKPEDGGFDPTNFERMTKAGAAHRHETAQAARSDPRIYDYLDWRYRRLTGMDGQILERCGVRYPVMIFPLRDPAQRDDLESVIPHPLSAPPEDRHRLVTERTFRDVLIRADRFRNVTENRPTFAMSRLSTAGALAMSCYVGSYFDTFDTSDVLEWELLLNAGKLNGTSEIDFEAFEEHLPLRSKLHRLNPDPVRDGSFRTAGIAISTLIVCKKVDATGRTFFTPLAQRRSKHVAAHPTGVHVIPSFMFQASRMEFAREEFSVIHNIKREYLEELFSNEEFDPDWRNPGRFLSDPRILPLQSMLRMGQATFYLTGVAVNLTTLRPEICTLLLIQTKDWHYIHQESPDDSLHFKFNFESLQGWDDQNPEDQVVGTIELSDNLCDVLIDPLKSDRMVPSGAAALWLGMELARTKLGMRNDDTRSGQTVSTT